MTKVRPALSSHHALQTVVTRIGWPRAVAVTRRRERAIRKWSEPDCGPGVPIAAALALDVAFIADGGTRPAPFEAWYQAHLQMAREAALESVGPPAQLLADAQIEVAQAFAAHLLCSCPGAGEREIRNAQRETGEAIVALSRTCLLPVPAE